MPTFATPKPISVLVELQLGDVRLVADERADTVVEVAPANDASESDGRAAEQVRVEYADGVLLVRAAKPRGRARFTRGGSVALSIGLPAGSNVRARTELGQIDFDGPLGDCEIKTGFGHVRVDRAEALRVGTGMGEVTIGRSAGRTEVTTGSGTIRISDIGGTGVVKNSNGSVWVGEAGGDLRLKSANGEISVDRAGGAVEAKTANGEVRVGEVARGTAVLETAAGGIEIGIRAGTAARLDVTTRFGVVRNSLGVVDSPEPSDETATVYARTAVGNIVIRRSTSAAPATAL
ncbi:hypothetical protein I6A84_00325 [Frankia sp. CNm7]|uniref:Adhesin domain-containing protein n=1 Tax=Frankia nepalensis TaxID=1836974 RepID=A0A937R4H8_9ACTN|nr:DUF4097 family beta strand repeat-containing protein [Frankia nepalensis]MBL7501896.1 hypothetical protein [Frankia nepalensis]MBL7513901.1 hypothetical protein [Frankia nepalensis]MBL7516609.1 hypothetical protein [Frankia nepalensis]MBL7625623.1 hypothetical protein [Frankia nepalensis]